MTKLPNKLIVVGMRFIKNAPAIVDKLDITEPLQIVAEQNEHAPGGTAYAVLTRDAIKIGYVRNADLHLIPKVITFSHDYCLAVKNSNYLVLTLKDSIKEYITPRDNPITVKYSDVVVDKSNPIKKEDQTMFEKIVANNKTVAVTAAYMEAGRIANNQVAKLVAAKAPLMVRGYVDTPVGKLVLANLTAMAVDQFRPADQKLKKVTNSMMANAYQELIQTLDIEGMLNELTTSEGIQKALNVVAGQENQS